MSCCRASFILSMALISKNRLCYNESNTTTTPLSSINLILSLISDYIPSLFSYFSFSYLNLIPPLHYSLFPLPCYFAIYPLLADTVSTYLSLLLSVVFFFHSIEYYYGYINRLNFLLHFFPPAASLFTCFHLLSVLPLNSMRKRIMKEKMGR